MVAVRSLYEFGSDSRWINGIEICEIPGTEGAYWAGDDGHIYSCKIPLRPIQLKESVRKKGTKYHSVGLSLGGRARVRLVHQLVCEAFHGSRPDHLTDTLHGDGDPSNNRPENLRWGTRSENLREMRVHGNAYGQKLSPADVREIRRLRQSGLMLKEIAPMFGVHVGTVSKVALRAEKGWAWVV